MKRLLKSPLRYPGGKSRAIDQILPHIPVNMREYREPFFGGGSVFFAVRSRFGNQLKYVINDLNRDLMHFWRYVRDDVDTLMDEAEVNRVHYAKNGRALYEFMRDENNMRSDFDRAVRCFIMNRITFSGVMDAGGYSEQAFERRFTASSIERVRNIAFALRDVDITCTDYSEIVQRPGENVFIFLDPPYYSATDSRLYGARGDLHTSFDHQRFAEIMKECPHRWLITYDDSPYIRKLFSFANIIEWQLQYGMNNVNNQHAAKGHELFIKNY